MITHIEPRWDIEEYRVLEYHRTQHKDDNLNHLYIESGHDMERMIIYNRFETEYLPQSCQYVREQFCDFDHVTLALMLITPGHYIPLHWDLYGAYRRLFNVGDRRIFRAIVKLEDSYPGQIIQVGDQTHGSWRAGAVFSWYDDELHGTYNMSRHNRYAIQITGIER